MNQYRYNLDDSISNLAWSILSDFYKESSPSSTDESRVLIDAIRLASLNHAINCRYPGAQFGSDENHLLFEKLSYECERTGIHKKDVTELVYFLTKALKKVKRDEIERLSKYEFVDLLGRIHHLGSFRLPFELQQVSSQKALGAFYTPPPLADYIVRTTLEPKLRDVVRAGKRDGVSAFQKLLSFRIIDPACGSGVFLVSTLRVIKEALHELKQIMNIRSQSHTDCGEPHQILLYGVDIDLGALEVTDISLQLLERSDTDLRWNTRLGSTLKQGNSLLSLKGINNTNNPPRPSNYFTAMKPFDWQDEFSEVFSRDNSGFDFTLMNPPYERLRPNFAEFMREQLLRGKREIQTSEFEIYKEKMKWYAQYFRNSNEFNLATSYVINTYQLFLERALQITRKGGNIGCIVPSNILGDVSAQSLRKELLLRNTVNRIDDFPEASKIFPGVTQSATILMITKGGKTVDFDIVLDKSNLQDTSKEKRFKINRERIQQLMGSSLVIPRVNVKGLQLLELMHKHPHLSSFDWIKIKRGELDLTLNKDLIVAKNTGTRLIRGSHIARYSLIDSKRKPEYVHLKQLEQALNLSDRIDHISKKRIACQQISNMGQRWRLKFAPIPPGIVLSNSCNYLVTTSPKQSRILDLLLGILNSELMNWRFQVSNFNNHVSIRELQNLPIVIPYSKTSKSQDMILREVGRMKGGAIGFSASLEASIFSLYGFGVDEAREVLCSRKCPNEQSDEIIDLL